MTKPVLLIDTCALRHLDKLTLGRRPLIHYLLSAFELRVTKGVYEEIKRHAKGMNLAPLIQKKRAEWRMNHCLDTKCLQDLLHDLPNTPQWYPHNNYHPNNHQHLFSGSANAGERELCLLFVELSFSGRTPILLTDDLKARRLAIYDLVGWKVRTGVLWITLDFVIYLIMTGLKRIEGKTVQTKFILSEIRNLIRDLVQRITGTTQLQQQLLTHYQALAEMTFNLVDANNAFTKLEKIYGQTKYR